VLAIKGDGQCCYYIASAIRSLHDNQHLSWVSCSSEDLKTTRTHLLETFRSWAGRKEVWCSSAEELEADYVMPHLGESSEVFRRRVTGEAVGKERWGTISDLALYTLQMDVLVVVIDAKAVSPTSSLADDDRHACAPAHFDRTEEPPKTRVVCAVLDRNHFSLGVVRVPQVRAIFQLGPDWDTARHLILGFIKARKSPSVPLCPQWRDVSLRNPPFTASPKPVSTTSADQRPALSLETKKNEREGRD